MTTYHKAIRPDGTSFADPEFRWGTEPGDVTVHPAPGQAGCRSAKYYLSVSTSPTDCSGMDWPARHLIVEPVEGYEVWTPDSIRLPNKRAASAWRTVEERPAHELLGPQGVQLAAFIERIHSVTEDELDRLDELADGPWKQLVDLRNVDPVINVSARTEAMECIRADVDRLSDYPRGVHVRGWDAIYRAFEALLVRDLINKARYATAVAPVVSVLGPLHPDD